MKLMCSRTCLDSLFVAIESILIVLTVISLATIRLCAVHRRRLGQAQQVQQRRRDVGQEAAVAQAGAAVRLPPTRISGTGLVVWAVCGAPVARSIISSALPWSAVTSSAPPRASVAATTRPTQASTVSTAVTAAARTPVWPTMSPLAKLTMMKSYDAARDALDQPVGHVRRAHLRLQVVGGDLRRGDQHAAPRRGRAPRGRR